MGLVHVYTGNGKGKTTAALGLAVRMAGHGKKVFMIQFLKGGMKYGELAASEKLENLTIKQCGRASFVDRDNPDPVDVKMAQDALELAGEAISGGEYDLVILDEVNVALEFGLIPLERVIEIVKRRHERVEIVLTGRYAPEKIVELGDYVTEMREIRHPYKEGEGVKSRPGVEY